MLAVILIHIPSVQTFICRQISSAVSDKLGTRVSIGKVDIGFLNRLIIDDFTLQDQSRTDMLKASRLSAKFEYIPLLTQGKIHISSVQLLGVKAQIYKKDAATPYNFQFVIDSLASKDTTSKTPLDLKINSLIIRRGEVKYDQWDKPQPSTAFSAHHLHIKNISGHIIVHALTSDSINVHLKSLSLQERSGLDIRSLQFKVAANKQNALLSSLRLSLPNTHISLDDIQARYKFEDNKLLLPTVDYSGSISPSSITLSDLSCFLPAFKKSKKNLRIEALFAGTSTSLRVNKFVVSSPQSHIQLLAEGSLNNWQATPKWAVAIQQLKMSAEGIRFIADNFGTQLNIPPHLTRLGEISYQGHLGGHGQEMSLKGDIKTDAGHANLLIGKRQNNFSCRIESSNINLKKILADDRFGNIATHIQINGSIPNKQAATWKAKGEISNFQYNNYTYKNINIDGCLRQGNFEGLLSIFDPNIHLQVDGKINLSSTHPYAKLRAEMAQFKPSALRLTQKWGNAAFKFNMTADIAGKNINTANGNIELTNFVMASDKDIYSFDRLSAKAYNKQGLHQLDIDSDFASLRLNGQYDYNTLYQSVVNLIGSKLPTLPGLPKTTQQPTNNFTLEGTVTQSDWLQKLFNIPLMLHAPLTLKGSMNDHQHTLDMLVDMPNFEYDGKKFEAAFININTPNDTLIVQANVNRLEKNNKKFNWNIEAKAHNNQLSSHIAFDNLRQQQLKGNVFSVAQFFKDKNNQPAVQLSIQPSAVFVGDTQWSIQPSQISYREKELHINNFSITNNNQHIVINGQATQNPEDSLTIDLKDINVAYILDLVNFHSVDFDGLASGTAVIKTPFDKPEAYSNLVVDKFQFEHGDMGTLKVFAMLNNKDKQIDLQAITHDTHQATTIRGYVSPQRNDIDLEIVANQTNLDFLESFCSSFMKDISAQGVGQVRLFGPLNQINLEGNLVLNGNLSISSLNTTYILRDNKIKLIPDNIIFKNDTVYDAYGNIGIINGDIYHKHLTNLSYDLNIQAQNLLAYDFKTFGDNTFYGTVKATGTCEIKGKSGEVNIDVDATPEEGTTLVYNVTSPDAVNNTRFIEWGEKVLSIRNHQDSVVYQDKDEVENTRDIPSDIRLNFLINTTPKATLKLIMDPTSGDHILLNGHGGIRASYYNKGNFDMYGNYQVEHGTYKLTIQNAIKKDFHFEEGGNIAFGGDPYKAQLNLKALYTANSVSLSDLNLGEGFSSNNIKVNCIMNIGGTPERPSITFDLDMPTVNTNVKQMIYSLINGEEEMNQQVLYLLAVGRFLTQGSNNADFTSNGSARNETSLAMQSLLSGTLSQQLNNVLSSVINNTNWNFGANISTGDEGWNNAQYEGLLSGRLLNNRLLFNGEFGYRDNANSTTNFIGDFDIRYLLLPSGNLAVRMYNQTNDRYFTKNSMTTQGLGLIMKKDFNGWKDLWGWSRKKNRADKKSKKTEQ
ncbi:MAG: translocation/assembly module TamB [Prevotellaceae bacterium]|nr:translocation/assembly module TamB [Prevotellaceae bacterium]MDY3365991.1 translocation/assembly module TamB domain-containing protein [Prevotella sp.]